MTQISRRKFLGKSALTATLAPLAASSLTAPFFRSARAAEPGANDKVRLGLDSRESIRLPLSWALERLSSSSGTGSALRLRNSLTTDCTPLEADASEVPA